MKVAAVVLVVLLAAGAITASSVPEDKSQVAHVRVRRQGFGCPFRQRSCHRHCGSIRGYKGGYCRGRFRQTCACYGK
uniref:Putative defensin n=1 Tax=Ixodes ricinus TaxID=34613 RepID=V5IE89_IXORI